MPRNTLFADDGNVQDFAKLVNAKTRNLYPVSEYGALGNGVADDRQAIIDAVSAAILTDGAIVLTEKHRVASATPAVCAGSCIRRVLRSTRGTPRE